MMIDENDRNDGHRRMIIAITVMTIHDEDKRL